MSNLPSTNQIPTTLTNAKIYLNGKELIGIANVELPDLAFMTDTISGLGIAGEVTVPVQGHFASMKMTLNWNTLEENCARLLEAKAHHLDMRGSVQDYDAGTGMFIDKPLKVLVRALPISGSMGKLEPAKKTESKSEMEITYVRMSRGGADVIEVDKLGFVFKINGEDKMTTIRANLGMN